MLLTVTHLTTLRAVACALAPVLAAAMMLTLRTNPTARPLSIALGLLAIALFQASACPLPTPSVVRAAAAPLLTRWRLGLTLGLLALSAVFWVTGVRAALWPDAGAWVFHPGLRDWLLSIALFTAAGLARYARFARPTWPRLTRGQWLEIGGIAALALFALLLRLVSATDVPYPFSGDEGSVGREALNVVQGKSGSSFSAAWSGQPSLSFMPTVLTIFLFGPDILAVRLPSIVLGTLSVPALYLLGRRMFGPLVGVLAAALLAGWHYTIHFSRLGVNNIGDVFFAALVFWLLYRALDRDDPLDYLWTGLAMGLTWYAYVGARLVFLLALLNLAFAVVMAPRRLRARLPGLVICAVSSWLVAGPQLIFFHRHQDVLADRMNQTGIIQTGWLAREAAARGVPQIQIVWEQFLLTLQVFSNLRPNYSSFYHTPGPILDPVLAALLMLGLAYAAFRILERRYFLLSSWFWSVIVIGGTMTILPPYVARLVLAAPAVCLAIAVALVVSARTLQQWGGVPLRFGQATAAAIVAIATVVSVTFYFREFVPGYYFEDINTEVGETFGEYMRDLGPNYGAYTLFAPMLSPGFPSILYLADLPKTVDVIQPITADTVPPLLPDKQTVFVAIPGRAAELALVREQYPGGELVVIPRRVKPGPQLYVYFPGASTAQASSAR